MAYRVSPQPEAGTSAPTEPTPAPPQRGAGGRRVDAVPILLQLLAMIGLAAVLLPAAADWFARLGHNAAVSGYVRSIEGMPGSETRRMIGEAEQYNRRLPPGTLVDPYGPDAGSSGQSNEGYRAYERLLSVPGTDVMGELQYSRLGIDLPLRHGTGEDALRTGAGHLYGSSLPVGGPSTHAVLTAHSGLVSAELFSGLHDAREGDVFSVRVLDQLHFYEVDRIETVLPAQTRSLGIVEGEDRVTLLTCTPIGVNSHRLLVHAVRVPAPATAEVALAGDGRAAGFPWWAVGFVGGSAAVAALVFAPSSRRGRRVKGAAAVQQRPRRGSADPSRIRPGELTS